MAQKKAQTPAQVAAAIDSLHPGSRRTATDLRSCEDDLKKSEENDMADSKTKKKPAKAGAKGKKTSKGRAAKAKTAVAKTAAKKPAAKKPAARKPAKRKSAAKAAPARKPAKRSRKKAPTVRLTKKSLRSQKKKLASLGYVKLSGEKKKLLALYEHSMAEARKQRAAARKAKSAAAKEAATDKANVAAAKAADAKSDLQKAGVSVPDAPLELKANPRRRSRKTSRKAARKPAKRMARRRSNPVATVYANPRKPARRRRSHARRGGSMARSHNPTFTAMQTAAAVIATGVSFTLVDVLDRFLATRSAGAIDGGKKVGERTGVGPFYGAEAAARIAQKPDMVRMGAQLGISVASFVAAYFVKNETAKAVLGGIGTGAGVHWTFQLLNSWVMPMVFKATTLDEKDVSLGARLYPAEQDGSQRVLAKIIKDENASLKSGSDAQIGAFRQAFPWIASAENATKVGAYVGVSGPRQMSGAPRQMSGAPRQMSGGRPPAPARVWPLARPALPARVPPALVAAPVQAGVAGCSGCARKRAWGVAAGECGPDCDCPECKARYGAMVVQQEPVARAAMAVRQEPVARPAAPAQAPATSNRPRFFDVEKNVWFTADGRQLAAAPKPAATEAKPKWFDAERNVWLAADGRQVAAPAPAAPAAAAAPEAPVQQVHAAQTSAVNAAAAEIPLTQSQIALVAESGLSEPEMMGAYAAQGSLNAHQIAGIAGTPEESPKAPKRRAVPSLDDLN